jgi:hypothetical protein
MFTINKSTKWTPNRGKERCCLVSMSYDLKTKTGLSFKTRLLVLQQGYHHTSLVGMHSQFSPRMLQSIVPPDTVLIISDNNLDCNLSNISPSPSPVHPNAFNRVGSNVVAPTNSQLSVNFLKICTLSSLRLTSQSVIQGLALHLPY